MTITVESGTLIPCWVWKDLFPEIDEDALKRVSTAWTSTATAATKHSCAINSAFQALTNSHTGVAADSAQAKAKSIADWFHQLSSCATELAQATGQASELVKEVKTAINVALLNLEHHSKKLAGAAAADPHASLRVLRILQLQTHVVIASLYQRLVTALGCLPVTVDVATTPPGVAPNQSGNSPVPAVGTNPHTMPDPSGTGSPSTQFTNAGTSAFDVSKKIANPSSGSDQPTDPEARQKADMFDAWVEANAGLAHQEDPAAAASLKSSTAAFSGVTDAAEDDYSLSLSDDDPFPTDRDVPSRETMLLSPPIASDSSLGDPVSYTKTTPPAATSAAAAPTAPVHSAPVQPPAPTPAVDHPRPWAPQPPLPSAPVQPAPATNTGQVGGNPDSLRPTPIAPAHPGSSAAGLAPQPAPHLGAPTAPIAPAPGPIVGAGGPPAAPMAAQPTGPNLTSGPMSVSGGAPAAPTSAMGAPAPHAPVSGAAPQPPAARPAMPVAPDQNDVRTVSNSTTPKTDVIGASIRQPVSFGVAPAIATATATVAAGAAGLGSIANDLRIAAPPQLRGVGSARIAWPTQFGPDDDPLALMPAGWDVVYQRALLPGESDAMLAGVVTTLRGLLYPYEQVRDLLTPQALFDVLGLGFSLNEGTGQERAAFDRQADYVDVIRCAGIPADDLIVPLAADVEPPTDSPIPPVVRDHTRPWAGTGEAPGSSSTAHIDEFEIPGTFAAPIPHLAEMWRLHADGRSTHVATWDARHAQWLGSPSVPIRPPIGRPLDNGRFATFRDNTSFATVLLSEDESVLIAPEQSAPAQFSPAADGTRRFIVDNHSIVAINSVTTTADWNGVPVQVLRRHDAMALVDCAAATRDAAIQAGFNQLAQGQWQTRWVPWAELSALHEEERRYQLPAPTSSLT